MPVKRYLNFTSLLAALSLIAYVGLTAFKLPSATQQAANPPQYFPETGHTVRDPFINYFLSTDIIEVGINIGHTLAIRIQETLE